MKKTLALLAIPFLLLAQNRILLHDCITPPDAQFAGTRPSSQSFVPKILEGKQAYLCQWDAAKEPWCEFRYPNARKLDTFATGKLIVEVWIPKDLKASHMGARFTDEDGETTQLIYQLDTVKPGWNTIEFNLDTVQKMPGSWGGGKLNLLYDQPIRNTGFSISFKDKQAKGAIGLGKIWFEYTSKNVVLDVQFDNPIHVLRAGKEKNGKLVWTNPSQDESSQNLNVEIKNLDGNTIATLRKTVTIKPGKSYTWQIPKPPAFGIYTINATHQGIKGNTLNHESSFAYMKTQGPTKGRSTGFGFGIQSHSHRFTEKEQQWEAQAIALCGAKFMRRNVQWHFIQPEKGQFDTSRYDKEVKPFEDLGIEIQLTLGSYVPKWAKSPNEPFSQDYAQANRFNAYPDLDAWGDFVFQFMKRNKHRIKYIESWNEPDLLSFANFTVDEYVELQRVFYESAKKAAPDTVVLTGGFAGLKMSPKSTAHPDYFREAVHRGKGYFDSIAFHAHGKMDSYIYQVNGMLDAMRDFGLEGATWYSNETSWPSIDNRQREQAELVWKKMLYAWAKGAIAYNWYDIRNDGYDKSYTEHNFGLIDRDYYPKQAYVAYNAVVQTLKNGTFVDEYDMPHGYQAFLFKNQAGEFILPSWSIEHNAPPKFIAITGIKKAATVIDIFGNEQALPVANEIAFLEVDAPKAIRFKKQSQRPIIITNLLETPNSISLAPDAATTFKLLINNPTKQKLDFTLGTNKHDEIDIKPDKPQTVAVEPNSTAAIPFTAILKKKDSSSFNQTITGEIAITGTNPQNWTIPVARKIPVGQNYREGKHDFVIDDKSPRKNLVVSAPHLAHLIWSGNDDLSGTVAFAKENKAFKIRVVVQDDIFRQKQDNQNIWQADSVQVAFKLPNQNIPWEIGFALNENGSTQKHIWYAPSGFNIGKATKAIDVIAKRIGSKTEYNVTLPFDDFGFTDDILANGFPINVLLNDSDEDQRDTMMAIAPGLGWGPKEPHKYPVIYVK